MKNVIKTSILISSLLLSPLSALAAPKAAAPGANPASTSGLVTKVATVDAKGAKPVASPGWTIVEEEVWLPLSFEPLFTLDAIRASHRQHEERAAATSIDKAVSWLQLAQSSAMPVTESKLKAAIAELQPLAVELRKGDIVASAKLDSALAKSAHALAEWHFFKVLPLAGRGEERLAANNLMLAANYLRHAANSANYQFGPDTTKIVNQIYKNGELQSTTTEFDHDQLAINLHAIAQAVKELGVKLK